MASAERRNSIRHDQSRRKSSILCSKKEPSPAKKKISSPVVTHSQDGNQRKDYHNFGVPKFLINKWLKIGNQKSKFVEKQCQIDNEDDISLVTESEISSRSSIHPRETLNQTEKRMSKFSIVHPLQSLKMMKSSVNSSQANNSNEADSLDNSISKTECEKAFSCQSNLTNETSEFNKFKLKLSINKPKFDLKKMKEEFQSIVSKKIRSAEQVIQPITPCKQTKESKTLSMQKPRCNKYKIIMSPARMETAKNLVQNADVCVPQSLNTRDEIRRKQRNNFTKDTAISKARQKIILSQTRNFINQRCRKQTTERKLYSLSPVNLGRNVNKLMPTTARFHQVIQNAGSIFSRFETQLMNPDSTVTQDFCLSAGMSKFRGNMGIECILSYDNKRVKQAVRSPKPGHSYHSSKNADMLSGLKTRCFSPKISNRMRIKGLDSSLFPNL